MVFSINLKPSTTFEVALTICDAIRQKFPEVVMGAIPYYSKYANPYYANSDLNLGNITIPNVISIHVGLDNFNHYQGNFVEIGRLIGELETVLPLHY